MDKKHPFVKTIESCIEPLASILADLIDAGDVDLDDFAEHLRPCIKALLTIGKSQKGGKS